MKFSRSEFLKTGAASAAAAAIGRAIPGAAQELHPSRLSDVDNFIIIMQENRSFDHYFGMLRGVRGFDDANALRLQNGRSVFYQPDPLNPDGYELPFHLDTLKTSAQRLHDLSHAWSAQHASLNGGKMDNWVPAHRAINGNTFGPLTMGYYKRPDLPFHYALADAFTICDGYHCSVLGPTYPNRIYHMSASIDADGKYGGPVTNNDAFDGGKSYKWETYPERLERARIPWQVYYDIIDDYVLNVLQYFTSFQNASEHSDLRQYGLTGQPYHEFLEDLRIGNLPNVTWVIAHAEDCEHPSYLPAAGENFVRSILEALWSNPAVWARTAVILNYDENDGQFDHVLPAGPPASTDNEFIGGLPVGLGFRVPCTVISPFSRGGYVCHETFDHTSVLRLLEARFGVEVPNLSPWRRQTCGDLTSAFGFGHPPDLSIPQLPETQRALLVAGYNATALPRPTVPKRQQMPVQEPGTRPVRG
jgi:phospholipase C